MKTYFICFVFSILQLFSIRQYDRMEFLVQSIPKGGTHLLRDTLELFRVEGCPPRYRWAHFSLGQAYNAHRKIFVHLQEKPETKKIVLVRDMRDVLISLMHYLDKAVSPSAGTTYPFVWFNVRPNSAEMKRWAKLKSTDEKLDYLLSPESNYFAYSEKQCADDSFSIVEMPNTLLLRFEDLVGERGGGSSEAQFVALRNLADHVCRKGIPDERLRVVAESMHGGKTFKEGGHFRKGLIGEWKKYFKPHHIAKAEELYGQFLSYYGYNR